MNYIINKNKQDSKSGENFEVHNLNSCEHLPKEENRIHLGNFNNCQEAMSHAKLIYPGSRNYIDSCYYCCLACHKE